MNVPRLPLRGKQLIAAILRLKGAGRYISEAGQAYTRGVTNLGERLHAIRHGTFKGHVLGQLIEKMGEAPAIQAAQKAIKDNQTQMFNAVKGTIEAGGDTAIKGIQRLSKFLQERASRTPVVGIPLILGGAVAEGAVAAGKIIGKATVDRYTTNPMVQQTGQLYGAISAVTSPHARQMSRMIGRWRKHGLLGRLLLGPRALPAGGVTLNPRKGVLEGAAGLPGRMRQALVNVGFGSKSPIAEVDSALRVEYEKLRRVNLPIIEARRRLNAGQITPDEFAETVKTATRDKAQIRDQVIALLRNKATGGYDVDKGHYLAGAGTIGVLAGRELKEHYDKFQATREATASQRTDHLLRNIFRTRAMRRFPKATQWDIDQYAERDLELFKRMREEQRARTDVSQVLQTLQQYPAMATGEDRALLALGQGATRVEGARRAIAARRSRALRPKKRRSR
jgi:hypothetical protein